MAQLATLTDAFNTTSASGKWTQTQLGSATLSYAVGGASVVFPATTSSSTDGDLSPTGGLIYDLTGSYAVLKVTSVPGAGATHTDAVLRVRQAGNNYLAIFYEAGTIFFTKVVAGSQTNITSTAYSATNHLWWRIRESGGTTFWETSADGFTWVVQTSQSNPIVVTAVDALIGGLCFGVDTSPANFTFSNFNFLPQAATLQPFLPGPAWIQRFAKAERHPYGLPFTQGPADIPTQAPISILISPGQTWQRQFAKGRTHAFVPWPVQGPADIPQQMTALQVTVNPGKTWTRQYKYSHQYSYALAASTGPTALLKVSGVTRANISKIEGVANASISKVAGVVDA